MYLITATQTNEMIQLSDKIQIASILVSLCIAVIGFIFSAISVYQTKKMIEETNRPNLIIYNDYQIVNGKHEKYFVITNIGNVPAMITNLEFDKPLDELNNNRFDKNLVNTVVVPGQVLKSIILNSYYETLQATLTYKRVTNKPYHHKDECYKKQSHKEDKYIYKTTLKTDMSKYLFYTVHPK